MNTRIRTVTLASLIAVAAVAPLTASAKGNPSAGQAKAKVCEACHGPTGKSVDPSYPNLAGQYPSYLEKALHDYKSGKRSNAIMAPMAAPLTEQDIEDIAAWYGKQDGLKDLSIN